MTDQPIPTVLAVDGNSLLHRSFHAQARTMYRTPDGAQQNAVLGAGEKAPFTGRVAGEAGHNFPLAER